MAGPGKFLFQRRQLLDVLKMNQPATLTNEILANVVGVSPRQIRNYLQSLVKEGLIEIYFQTSSGPTKRPTNKRLIYTTFKAK